mgnify:CR=1 FL=1
MKTIQKGFTLIELMIVIAIVGILAAIALPAYQNYTASAKFSEVIASVAPIKTAIEICVQKKGPSDMTTCDQEAEFGAVLASASASGDYVGSVVVATSGTNGEITATSATINLVRLKICNLKLTYLQWAANMRLWISLPRPA